MVSSTGGTKLTDVIPIESFKFTFKKVACVTQQFDSVEDCKVFFMLVHGDVDHG